MPWLIGAGLAFGVGLFGTASGLDRDRAFYTTIAIVIAALYSLFAVMGGSTHALVVEAIIGVILIVIATMGYRTSLWTVAGVLAFHGVFDFVHGAIIENPGVPPYWPAFCGSYDLVAAAYLAWLIKSGRVQAAVVPN